MTHRVTPDRSFVFTLFTKHSLVTTRFHVVIFPSSDDQFVPGFTSHLWIFVKGSLFCFPVFSRKWKVNIYRHHIAFALRMKSTHAIWQEAVRGMILRILIHIIWHVTIWFLWSDISLLGRNKLHKMFELSLGPENVQYPIILCKYLKWVCRREQTT